MSLSQLALKFILYNPKVTSVLPNITSLEELKHFVEIEEKPDLTEEEFNYLLRFSLDKFKDLNEESVQETLRYK
jgi:aryl-alcohol dehydrogenase-like predicted oxidoreductase